MNGNPTTQGRRIWITGATSGIGRALVKEFIHSGDNLILTARNGDDLERLRADHPSQIEILPFDIAESGSEEKLAERLGALTGHLDMAVLNAGTCEYVDIDRFDTEMFERIISVNFLGMVRCIEVCLPLMKNMESRPQIVGISSAAAITGLPRAEAYGASKAAVDGMLESLSLDLKPYNIDVTIVHPGFVDTPLTRKNDFPMPFLMSAEKAAGIIVKGIQKRKPKVVFPRRLIWPLRLLSTLPGGMRNRLGGSMVRSAG